MTARLGRADLHLHTLASDGTAGVVELLEHVETATDLDVVARAAASILHTALRRGWEAAVLWAGADRPAIVRGTWEQIWDALARVQAQLARIHV